MLFCAQSRRALPEISFICRMRYLNNFLMFKSSRNLLEDLYIGRKTLKGQLGVKKKGILAELSAPKPSWEAHL